MQRPLLNRPTARLIAWTSRNSAKLSARANWINLSKIRNSFLSKAITVFSLATFGLANFAIPLQALGVDLWRVKLTFIGSALFLIGYAVTSFRMPIEFQGTADLHEVADRMTKIHDYQFFRSRREMTASLLKRLEKMQRLNELNGAIEYAKHQIFSTEDKTESTWNESARSLYHADVALRQYDRPFDRVVALLLLATGISILFIPTLVNFVYAVFSLSA